MTKTCLIAVLGVLAAGSAWGDSTINCALTSPTPGASAAPCVDFSNLTGPGYNNSYSWLNLNGGSIMVSSSNPDYAPEIGTTTGGIPITVGVDGPSPEVELMGNTSYVDIAGHWMPAVILNDAAFPGHFGFNTANAQTGYSGDTILADPDPQAPLTIDFGEGVSAVAFQVSSLSDPTFIATLNAYGATGNLLGTYILNTGNLNTPSSTLNGGTEGNAVGGTCIFLSNITTGSNGYHNIAPGYACANTPAPFMGLSEQSMQLAGANQIYSIQISTNDPTGFAIDTLYLEEATLTTPEPSAPWLFGLGLSLIFLSRRNFRRS